MNHRDQLALHAPVTPAMVAELLMRRSGVQRGPMTHYDYPRLESDHQRAAFFALWAALRYEFADAMIKESQRSR